MCPHVPSFPPNWKDFGPGNPFKWQPPLPRFSWNPSWLTSEQKSTLEAEFGEWAAHRAEKMVPQSRGFEVVRQAAYNMLEPYISQLPPLPTELVTPTAERKRRERKTRIPRAEEGIEELGKMLRPTELTPEREEKLIATALEVLKFRRRPPTPEEKEELAEMPKAWMEKEGINITEEKSAEIAKKALARFVPIRA